MLNFGFMEGQALAVVLISQESLQHPGVIGPVMQRTKAVEYSVPHMADFRGETLAAIYFTAKLKTLLEFIRVNKRDKASLLSPIYR